jgi:hypothetical protein
VSLLRADDFQITGPYTHENLSIFLIHRSRIQGSMQLLTLREALEQKKTVVYETGSVNELSIENLSSERVYVQSGDIVKGGQQDRVLTTDFILPAHSGKIPVASFCVEQGRWSRRGAESVNRFDVSSLSVAGKSLKMAVREQGAQTKVWDQVANTQQELALATQPRAGGGASGTGSGGGVGSGAGTASASENSALGAVVPASASMQLSLESKPVTAATAAHEAKLAKVVDGKNDVVGFAYSVNGNLSGADVYASNDLFRRMWPKLLKASAVEAVAERPKAKSAAPPSNWSVKAALAAAELGRSSTTEVTARTSVVKRDSDKAVVFETRERDADGWIHKSYIVK